MSYKHNQCNVEGCTRGRRKELPLCSVHLGMLTPELQQDIRKTSYTQRRTIMYEALIKRALEIIDQKLS